MGTAPDRKQRIFLTAKWRHLVMLNYPIERAFLEPLVPRGLDLDEFESITYVSVVGFLFLQTRVMGDFRSLSIAILKRSTSASTFGTGCRKAGVAAWSSCSEIVPRRVIARLARSSLRRAVFGVPDDACDRARAPGNCVAAMNGSAMDGRELVAAAATGEPATDRVRMHSKNSSPNITGVIRSAPDAATQYQVEHPSWRVWRATEAQFDADIASLYGAGFVASLSVQPACRLHRRRFSRARAARKSAHLTSCA